MNKDKRKNESDNAQKKKDALLAVCSQIDKEYGTGSVMILGQRATQKLAAISTGSLQIDEALGIGGVPRGRIIEIFGPESSGKTTLALGVIAQAQARGGITAFIDAEHALDPLYAEKIGVQTADLVVSQPDYGEQALDIAETLIRSGTIDVIVIDSVAALVPKSELEGDMGDVHVGLQARLMSQALRKLAAVVHKSHTVLIFINQIRHNISALPYANKETTTGGNALKFYASLRLDVRRVESIKKDNVIVGNRVAVKVVKNKVAPPFRRTIVDMIFGRGIDPTLDLLDAGLARGLITQSGSWFSFGDDKIAQGRLGVARALATDAALHQKIRTEIEKKMCQTKEFKKGDV